jgi:branched-chain amino acid transport system permease protein
MSYFADLALRLVVIANLALALSIPFRWGGRLILSQGIFVALGAYMVAISVFRWQLHPVFAVLVATLAGAVGGWLLARIAAPLNGATFALLTFLLALAGIEVFENWDSMTGGRTGIGGLPNILVPLDISPKTTVALALLLMCLIFFLIVRFLFKSHFGRAVRAARDDATGAELDGISVAHVERDMFILFGLHSALVGALWAFALPRIIPEYFDFAVLSLPIVLACILGGGEEPRHSLLGAVLVLALDEGTQQLPVSPQVRADVPLLMVGIAYVAVALAGGHSSLMRIAVRFKGHLRRRLWKPLVQRRGVRDD